MAYLPDILSVEYFYVTHTKEGMPVDMGYVLQSRLQELVARAQRAGCNVTLSPPNNTCH